MCERSIVLPEVGRITGSFISVHMRGSRNSSGAYVHIEYIHLTVSFHPSLSPSLFSPSISYFLSPSISIILFFLDHALLTLLHSGC